MAKNKSVFGIYLKRSEMDSAVAALRDAGFSTADISVLLPEDVGSGELVTEKATKAPAGAAYGAGSGAAVGGALGWLVGVGALAIPGIGPIVAAGPLLAALAGVGVGGALGGFTGVLIGAGIPEDEAKKYEGRLLKGGILVAVHCETTEEISHAKGIMEVTGAESLDPDRAARATLLDRAPAVEMTTRTAVLRGFPHRKALRICFIPSGSVFLSPVITLAVALTDCSGL